jgi:hypothetical protein
MRRNSPLHVGVRAVQPSSPTVVYPADSQRPERLPVVQGSRRASQLLNSQECVQARLAP